MVQTERLYRDWLQVLSDERWEGISTKGALGWQLERALAHWRCQDLEKANTPIPPGYLYLITSGDDGSLLRPLGVFSLTHITRKRRSLGGLCGPAAYHEMVI